MKNILNKYIYVDIQVNEVMKGHCFTEPPKPCPGK